LEGKIHRKEMRVATKDSSVDEAPLALGDQDGAREPSRSRGSSTHIGHARSTPSCRRHRFVGLTIRLVVAKPISQMQVHLRRHRAVDAPLPERQKRVLNLAGRHRSLKQMV